MSLKCRPLFLIQLNARYVTYLNDVVKIYKTKRMKIKATIIDKIISGGT